ncbi:hypothetical protein HZS_2144 [Henneguya salminicola]|nr:hypothetical protein HZS_2144 [Henneguya salminicola]
MSDKKRADELIQEAQSKKSGGFFKKIFGTHDDADDIIDLYKKAASHYKIAKEWEGILDQLTSRGW